MNMFVVVDTIVVVVPITLVNNWFSTFTFFSIVTDLPVSVSGILDTVVKAQATFQPPLSIF